MKALSKILFVATSLLFSCDGDDQVLITGEDLSYFPLEVGNRWEYEPIVPDHTLLRSVVYSVIGTEMMQGEEYFAMERISESVDGTIHRDTAYYHVDTNDYVFEKWSFSNTEGNVFRLGAIEGEQWNLDEGRLPNDVIVTARLTSVTLRDKVIHGCKSFSFDSPTLIDEERTYILAKGIGIVWHSNAWGFNYRLKGARIAGADY